VASSRIWKGLAVLERAGLFIWRRIEPWGQGLLPVRHTGQALVLGLLWDWFTRRSCDRSQPPNPLCGGALMAAFGIGARPMLLVPNSVADKFIALTGQPRVRQIAGSVIIVMGLLTLFGVIRPLHIGLHPVDNMLCGPDYPHGKVTN
jgi:hypothetical protein